MKPTVLMLGWEYPPLINGGLGIASMGLAQALGQYLPVRIILPKANPETIEDQVNIIGLDQQDLQGLWEGEEGRYQERMQDLRLNYVNVPLSGYETFDEEGEMNDDLEILPPRFFEIKELYGYDLPRKIIDYSEISLRLAEDLDFDIIHAHDWMTFPAAMEISKASGKPLVLHLHSTEYDRGGKESKNWVYDLEKKAMEMADLVIAVSYYTADIIRKHYEIDPKKVKAIHNAIHPVHAYRKEKPFKDKLITFVGRLEKQKGPRFFFEMAMELLARKDGIRFIMAGKGSELSPLLDSVSTALIGDKFHFAGFLSQAKIRDLLAMSDVCVMPSVSEPFGLIALEATQMGVPCVIPYQSGVSELLLESPKFQAGDVKTLSEQVFTLLENDRYHQQIVSKNQAAIRNLSWDKTAQQVIDCYQEMLIPINN